MTDTAPPTPEHDRSGWSTPRRHASSVILLFALVALGLWMRGTCHSEIQQSGGSTERDLGGVAESRLTSDQPGVRASPFEGDGATRESGAESRAMDGAVRARVVSIPGDVPCADVEVQLTEGWLSRAALQRGRTDAAGYVTFIGLVPGPYTVAIPGISSVGGIVAAGVTNEMVIRVFANSRIFIETVDDSGAAVSGASIRLSTGVDSDSRECAVSDLNGKATVFPVSPTQWIAASAPELAPSRRRLLAEKDFGTVIKLVLSKEHFAVSGRVFLPDGEPASGAVVSIGDVSGRATSTDGVNALMSELVEKSVTDTNGNYAFPARPRRAQFIYVTHPKAAPERMAIEPNATQEVSQDIHLKTPGVIVVELEGTTKVDVQVRAAAATHGFFSTTRGKVGGTCRIEGCPRTKIDLIVELPGGETMRHECDLTNQSLDTWVCTVAADLTLEGRVATLNGVPLVGWEVRAFDPSSELLPIIRAKSNSEGAFTLRGVAQKEYTVELWKVPSQNFPVQRQFSVSAPRKGIEFRVDPASRGGGSLKGRLVTARGEAVGGVEVTARTSRRLKGDSPSARSDVSDGRFSIELIPEGECELGLVTAERALHVFGPYVVVSDSSLDVGDLIVPAPVPLLVTIQSDAATASKVDTVLVTDEMGRRIASRGVSESNQSATLLVPPGTYLVSASGESASCPAERVTVRAEDSPATIKLTAVPARRVVLVIRLPSNDAPPEVIRVRILDSAGRVIHDAQTRRFEGDFSLRIGLPGGPCTGEVHSNSQRLGTIDVPAIAAGSAAPTKLVIDVKN